MSFLGGAFNALLNDPRFQNQGFNSFGVMEDEKRSVFICYAHADNTDSDPQRRWLDRVLEFLRPFVRQEGLNTWSDRDLKIGDSWHQRIWDQLDRAKVAILLISPAFLASDYIANSELPVLLKRAADQNTVILPVILSPCLYESARFRFPDANDGPNEMLLSSIQAANPPSRTLVEMTEGEQNRVLLDVANRVMSLLGNQVASQMLREQMEKEIQAGAPVPGLDEFMKLR